MERREVLVKTANDNLVRDISYSLDWHLDDIFRGRIFEDMKQIDLLSMVLSKSGWAIEHGLGCPRDARKALEKIESLPKFN